MSWTASPEPDVLTGTSAPAHHDPELLVEEIACAIAVAQAALRAGRIDDLLASVQRQQQLCGCLNAIRSETTKTSSIGRQNGLQTAAQQARRQNQVFGAVLSRMRGHLATLRNLLHGPSLSYRPESHKTPGRES